jgi:hypothetical protein
MTQGDSQNDQRGDTAQGQHCKELLYPNRSSGSHRYHLFGRATEADADTVAAPKPGGKGVENEELGKGFVWFAEMTYVKAPWPEGSE